MSDTFVIQPGEWIHVFAPDMDTLQAEALADDTARLAPMLGIGDIDISRVEAFAAETLVGIGVSGYLTDGQGAAMDAILPDEPMLDNLTGPILLLLPKALGDDVRSLTVSAPLRHIASYPTETATPAAPHVHTPSAEPSPSQTLTAAERKRADRKASGYVATATLLVLFLIVAIIVWIA